MTLNVYPCIFPLALCFGYLLYYYDTSHFLFFLLFCTSRYNCMYYKCLAQIKKQCALKRIKLNVDLKLLLIIMLLFLSVHAIKMLYIYQFMLNVHIIKRHYEFSAQCLYSGTEVNECRTRDWESDVAESHSDYLLSVCSNSLQIYINFIK